MKGWISGALQNNKLTASFVEYFKGNHENKHTSSLQR